MRRSLILLLAVLGLLGASMAPAGAADPPSFATSFISQGEVDNVSAFYSANIQSLHGDLRVEDDFDTAPPAANPHPYSWRLQEWVPSSIGCGCFDTISTTGGVVADGLRHAQCYTYGVESGKTYRVKYGSFNNFPYSFTGHWWEWGYDHNC